MVELLEARPRDELLVESLRAIIRETLGDLYRRDPDRLLTRLRLAATVPEIRARFLDAQTHGIEEVAGALTATGRASVDDLSLRVATSAMLSTVFVATDIWERGGGKADLVELFDEATDALASVARDLSVKPATTRA